MDASKEIDKILKLDINEFLPIEDDTNIKLKLRNYLNE